MLSKIIILAVVVVSIHAAIDQVCNKLEIFVKILESTHSKPCFFRIFKSRTVKSSLRQ